VTEGEHTMTHDDTVTPSTALTEIQHNPVADAVRVVDDTSQRVLGQVDQLLEVQASELYRRLGTETDAATIDALFHVLTQRVEVLGGRSQLHLALSELIAEIGKEMDVDAAEIALAAAYHILTRPDAVAVAFICTVVQDLVHELAGLVAVVEETINWGIAIELVTVQGPMVSKMSADMMLEVVEQYPDLLSWAAPHLQHVKDLNRALVEAGSTIAELVHDPVGALIEATQLITAALHVLSDNLRSGRADAAADLREIRHEPMALGEQLGHVATFIIMAAAGVVLSEADIAAIAARLARTAAEEAGLLADIIGATDKVYKSKLETFERFRHAIRIYRLDRNVRKGFKATGRLLRVLSDVAGVDQQVARDMAAIANDVVRAQFKRLHRRVGGYKILRDINEVFNDRALIGLVLTARGEGLTSLTLAEELLAANNLRKSWLEAAHIVDKRFLPLFADDFAAIGWASVDEMPAVNATSGEHTESLRRFLQALLRQKGDPSIVVAGDDLMANAKSITRIFDDRIWAPGSKGAPKPGAFVVDPKTTKPSQLLEEIRKIWQNHVKRFKLPPEGFAQIDNAIMKLRALGR
jgi:hypothetical protein